MEEAMTQLNWGSNPGAGDLSQNGWVQHNTTNPLVSSYGPPGERFLVDGTYYASILASTPGAVGATATIYSTGFVTAPVSGKLISRKVMVTAMEAPMFPYALDAKTSVKLTGNTTATVPFNSYDPTVSTNGQLLTGHYLSTGADMAIASGTATLGNDTITGNLYVGPNASYSKGTVTGTINNDYNVQIPDVSLPPVLWSVASPTNIVTSNVSTNKKGVVTTTYTTNQMFDFTQNGYYQIPSADGNIPIQIESNITATLDIKSTSVPPATITLIGANSNAATAIVYQESGSATLTGGGYRAANFIYYGLPGVTSIVMNGNSSGTFTGVIYAPEADMNQNGTPATIIGSVTVNTYKRNGNATYLL